MTLTKEEITAAREWTALYGSANCWCGTFGSIAATLKRLLDWYEEQGDEHE